MRIFLNTEAIRDLIFSPAHILYTLYVLKRLTHFYKIWPVNLHHF